MKSFKRFFLPFYILIILATILQGPMETTAAYNWEFNKNYCFTTQENYFGTQTNTSNQLVFTMTSNTLYERLINITSMDLISGQITYFVRALGGESQITTSFLMDDFLQSISLSSLFQFNYKWDYDQNTTILTHFNIAFDIYYFLETKWADFNQYFKELFNSSEIIAQVLDPYELELRNITFGDFLNSIPSYSINDKTLADFKAKVKDDNRQLKLFFDLSNAYYFGEYNATLGRFVYHPIEKMTIAASLHYSKDGILQRNDLYLKDTKTTKNNLLYNEEYSLEIIFGPKESLSAAMNPLIALPAIFVSVLIMLRKKKKQGVENQI